MINMHVPSLGLLILERSTTTLVFLNNPYQAGDEQLTKTAQLAKTIVVFMVRGLFSKLQFPYAQFPCDNLSGDLLYDPFWEAVGRLENCGFKVCEFFSCMSWITWVFICFRFSA